MASTVIILLCLAAGLYTTGRLLYVYIDGLRFQHVANRLQQAETIAEHVGEPQVWYGKYCSHSNFGGVFERDSITCQAVVRASYVGVSEGDAQEYTRRLVNALDEAGFGLKRGTTADSYKVGTYSFGVDLASCYLDSYYYRRDDQAVVRTYGAAQDGQAAFIELACSAPASRDYFPKAS